MQMSLQVVVSLAETLADTKLNAMSLGLFHGYLQQQGAVGGRYVRRPLQSAVTGSRTQIFCTPVGVWGRSHRLTDELLAVLVTQA